MEPEIDISKQVLQKIKQEKIIPEPRWKFLLKDYLVWIFFGFSILLGGLTTAVIIFLGQNSGWEIYSRGQASWAKFVLLNIPYFWLIFFILFVFVAYYNFRHTNTGYRHRFFYIMIISVVCSIILGTLSYGAGLGQKIEDVFYRRMPFYEQIMRHRQDVWQQPGKGFLVGEIIINNEETIILRDPMNNEWILVFPSSTEVSFENFVNQKVRTLGKILEPGKFEVRMIELLRPCKGKPGCNVRQLPPSNLR